MATLSIPDHVLRQAGLTERDALVEFACRLFDAGKITLWSAARTRRARSQRHRRCLAGAGDSRLPAHGRRPGAGFGYAGPPWNLSLERS